MTHFLGRLVERARGIAPRVEPIVAPRFAPATFLEEAIEDDVPAPARRREASEKPTIDPIVSRTPKEEEPTAKGKPNEEIAAKINGTPPALLLPRAPSHEALTPDSNWTSESSSPRRDDLPLVQSAAPLLVRRSNQPHRSATPRSPDRPAFATNVPQSPNDSALPQSPIVRVTIGRIEVRAAAAPTPPARKASRASEPKLTLDAYLKSRKEGAR